MPSGVTSERLEADVAHTGEQHRSGRSGENLRQQGEHVESGAGRSVQMAHPNGRRTSWVAVLLMLFVFTVGGIALVFHAYWLTVVCGVIFLLAFGFALANGIMNDTH